MYFQASRCVAILVFLHFHPVATQVLLRLLAGIAPNFVIRYLYVVARNEW